MQENQQLGRYILVGQTPVPCEELLEWAEWMETGDRRVFFTRVRRACDVSTVFLGLDHNFFHGGPPILFETMTFWIGGYNSHQDRCSTWIEAEAQHRSIEQEVRDLFWHYAARALYEWIATTWRDLEQWGERQEKKQRGIPLSSLEEMQEMLAGRHHHLRELLRRMRA